MYLQINFTSVEDKTWFEDELNAALEKPPSTGKEKKGSKAKEEKVN